jgi:C_GCAxxG_C_C family probable redox protein
VTEAALVKAIAGRAKRYFLSGRLFCSEALLYTFNLALGGGFPPEVVRLASGFPEGIGRSGCTCGALSGGVLVLGLFCGRKRPGDRSWRRPMKLAAELHDSFKKAFGATCCRVPTRNIKRGSKVHLLRCAEITERTAELVGTILLSEKPELTTRADVEFLSSSPSFPTSPLCGHDG